jgi:hypothetical protein
MFLVSLFALTERAVFYRRAGGSQCLVEVAHVAGSGLSLTRVAFKVAMWSEGGKRSFSMMFVELAEQGRLLIPS